MNVSFDIFVGVLYCCGLLVMLHIGYKIVGAFKDVYTGLFMIHQQLEEITAINKSQYKLSVQQEANRMIKERGSIELIENG